MYAQNHANDLAIYQVIRKNDEIMISTKKKMVGRFVE